MGKNLAQTPLTAVIFAAVWCFLEPFFPISESYTEALSAFKMPVLGYVFMIAYGLSISVILALVFSNARGKGIVLTALMLIPMLCTQWVSPLIRQIAFGETTGVMTQVDSVVVLAEGSAATALLLVLVFLLFKTPQGTEAHRPPGAPQRKPDKYRVKKRNFVVTLIVLPVIYMVAYLLTSYFLLLGNEAARTFYGVSPDTNTFAKYLVDILLNDSRQIPMALIKGLLYAFPLIPLLFQLAHKRVMFIITSVMLMLAPALRMLVPSAVIPDAVRMAHLVEMSAAAVAFGGLGSFMMRMCMFKEPAKELPMPPARRAAGTPATPPAPAAKA